MRMDVSVSTIERFVYLISGKPSDDSGKTERSPASPTCNSPTPVLTSTPLGSGSAKNSPVHHPVPRLESFTSGQVYNKSKAVQVHVLPASNTSTLEMSG